MGHSPCVTQRSLWRERSEANCWTCGWKSRRRKFPCGAVVISGSSLGTGSPDVKALGGRGGHRTILVGSAQGASNQEGRSESERTNRRNGLPHEADSSGMVGDAKSFFPLFDGQCRRGRMGIGTCRISRRKWKAAILESPAVKARKVW